MPPNILVPMDTSEQARNALAFALSEYGDASIIVLHVINPVDDMYFVGEEGIYVDFEALKGRAQALADRIFRDARTIANDHGVTIETDTMYGQTARSIVTYIDEHDIDQVVLGNQGRTGVSRWLLGSVAENVVRRSPVPVTVVR